MIKSIIIDYGGTLDTNGDHWSHVIRQGYEKAGVAVDDALFREAYVFGEQELERALKILPHYNFSDLMQVKVKIELQYLASHGPFPPEAIETKATQIAEYCYAVAKENTIKSIPVLETLVKSYTLVLVSNFYGNLDAVLKDFGIYKFFKKVIESAKVGVRKPDTAIFSLAIKELGDKPEEILVIGDSYKNDIAPARKLGCQTLWLKGKSWTGDKLIEEDIPTINLLEEVLGLLSEA